SMDETYMTRALRNRKKWLQAAKQRRKRFLSRSEAIFQRFHDDESSTKGMQIRSINSPPLSP
ncbi:MAG: hypothetical protein WCO89_11005, partial [Syntrophus sp. (in: bacteria)]